MIPRQLHYFCKRKLLKINPIFAVLLIIIFLSYYEGWFSWLRTCERNEDISPNSDFIKTKAKLIHLTSLLKRYNVPRRLYEEREMPVIYIITPTFARPVQKAELTRLKNTFLHVPALHWIIVEDAEEKTPLVTKFLASSGLTVTHLNIATPPKWKTTAQDPRWWKPRAVWQRNEAIKWLRSSLAPSQEGVVYFADDDNTYTIELFEEMRYTKKVSVWPVGLVGSSLVERPSVNSRGVVDGWVVGWRPDRPFAIDMAGFALNLGLLLRSTTLYFNEGSERGFMESDFLESLLKKNLWELEPKANGCTQVLVWHTQTKDPKINYKMKKNAGKLEV